MRRQIKSSTRRILHNSSNRGGILPLLSRLQRRYLASSSSSSSSWSFPTPPPPPSDEEIASQGLPLLRQVVAHADKPFLTEWPVVTSHNNTTSKNATTGTAEASSISSSSPVLSYAFVVQKAVAVANFIQQRQHISSSPFVAHSTIPGSDYIACQWGCFASAKASVPLAISHQVPELEHVLSDSNPSIILVTDEAPNYQKVLQAAANLNMSDRIVHLKSEILALSASPSSSSTTTTTTMARTSSNVDPEALLQNTKVRWDTPALLLYTSGTTGKPKGVLVRHDNLYHQVTDLVAAWEWQSTDIALHVLPLHHVHGVVNLLSCAAHVGAQLQLQPFDADQLWHQWAAGTNQDLTLPNHDTTTTTTDTTTCPPALLSSPNVFMAVPTIYAKLLEAASHLPRELVEQAVEHTLRPMRLQVSGSAALPASILEQWKALTGHTLLERYGMTEFAMALSNPYREEGAITRQPGHVGLPLPSVRVRLVEETNGSNHDTITNRLPISSIETPNTPGALQVKGPTVFSEYWNRPDATAEAFTSDGYFETGDVAEYNDELDSYRILGRASVDILKVGGHKISALEIERELLEHPDLLEVAIVGISDPVWGQRVGMIARTKTKTKTKADHEEQQLVSSLLDEIQTWCQPRLAKYKIPTRLRVVQEIPKNAMGKVNKKELVHLFDDKVDTS